MAGGGHRWTNLGTKGSGSGEGNRAWRAPLPKGAGGGGRGVGARRLRGFRSVRSARLDAKGAVDGPGCGCNRQQLSLIVMTWTAKSVLDAQRAVDGCQLGVGQVDELLRAVARVRVSLHSVHAHAAVVDGAALQGVGRWGGRRVVGGWGGRRHGRHGVHGRAGRWGRRRAGAHSSGAPQGPSSHHGTRSRGCPFPFPFDRCLDVCQRTAAAQLPFQQAAALRRTSSSEVVAKEPPPPPSSWSTRASAVAPPTPAPLQSRGGRQREGAAVGGWVRGFVHGEGSIRASEVVPQTSVPLQKQGGLRRWAAHPSPASPRHPRSRGGLSDGGRRAGGCASGGRVGGGQLVALQVGGSRDNTCQLGTGGGGGVGWGGGGDGGLGGLGFRGDGGLGGPGAGRWRGRSQTCEAACLRSFGLYASSALCSPLCGTPLPGCRCRRG